MTYTAETAWQLRTKGGSMTSKLATELALIDTELNGGIKVAKGALTADVSGNMAFTWQNPESVAVIVTEVIIQITTAGGTATSVLDVDVSSSATGTGDTIFDGIDLNSTGYFSSHNVSSTGTNGDEKPHYIDANGGTNDWITGKILVADASTLVGNYYISYMKVYA